ncbi:MAG: hypothetical protein DME97_14700 [Verrucomicrobia bacterium]|nr:MAG: hypothetical protein DME97_14700 [Verrucomicrobiota bacterium]
MLRTAETDWLAHILVCLFQECTSAFYSDCKDFYGAVEARYKLPGFFRGWLAHIELDLDYDHSGFFDDALRDIGGIPRAEVAASLRSFWFTFDFLLDALDEIEAEGTSNEDAPMRLPVSRGTLDSKATALLLKHEFLRPIVLCPRTAFDLQRSLAASGVNLKAGTWRGGLGILHQDLGFLIWDLTKSVYLSLSYSSQQDCIICLGRISERAFRGLKELRDTPSLPATAYAFAIANFIREMAPQPSKFLFILDHFLNVLAATFSGSTRSFVDLTTAILTNFNRSVIRDFLERWELDLRDVDRLSTAVLQFNELYYRWLKRSSDSWSRDPFAA